MTYNDILRVHPAITELSRVRLPVQKAWRIYNLKKEIDERYSFYCQEEMKLAEKYALCSDGKPIISPAGQIGFSSPERRAEYEKAIGELKNCNIGNPETIVIYISELDGNVISPETIGKLQPLIEIKLSEEV